MSASFSAAAAVLALVAPAAAYSSSVKRDGAPAPLCTATSAPSAANFFTVSGVAATRVSALSTSAGTAIFIATFLLRTPTRRGGGAKKDQGRWLDGRLCRGCPRPVAPRL